MEGGSLKQPELQLEGALLSALEYGIRKYAEISGILYAPESFIRDAAALYLHQTAGMYATVETNRGTLAEWCRISPSSFDDVGVNFRADLSLYHKAPVASDAKLAAIIELKLWASPKVLKLELERVRKMTSAIRQHGLESWASALSGFVVCCPVYEPRRGVRTVEEDRENLVTHFGPHSHRIFEVPLEDGNWGAGVFVLNASLSEMAL